MVELGPRVRPRTHQVLQALRRLLQRGGDSAQLDLGLAPQSPQNETELLNRLRALGLERIETLRLTRNRNVMVSFAGERLRVHAQFLSAPEHVHRAIVTFVQGRTRAEKREAQKIIVSHPVVPSEAPTRRERTHNDDEPVSEKLANWHRQFNERHFSGTLAPISVRISRRMKSRLGHYSPAAAGQGAEIAISRRHLRRNGWNEALQTLLHEMVHQWQAETGRPIDHGAEFRRKAREIGVAPRARRVLR